MGKRAGLLVVAVGLLACATPATASSVDHQGCQTVHVGPQIAPGGAPASYFRLTAGPGAIRRASVLIANPEPYSCGVTLVPAYGKTAANSGDTYPVTASGHCASTSCWLSGLPVTVQVPPGQRIAVPFTIEVPSTAASGDYLAGVVAGPAVPPTPRVVPRGRDTVGVAIVAHVAIGVAIRVPGAQDPRVQIGSVSLQDVSPAAILRVVERNTGNSWEHPQGRVLITVPQRMPGLTVRPGSAQRVIAITVPGVFKIRSSTLLPGDSATLPIVIGDVPRGRWPTVVELWYDHHRRLAVWRGEIGYPTPPRILPNAEIAPAIPSPSSAVPGWVIGALVGLGGMSCALAAMVLALLVAKRRRRLV